MDALRRLFGLKRDPELVSSQVAPAAQEPVALGSGWDLEVVGESFYQEALWALVAGVPAPGDRVRMPVVAVLEPQPDNPYDANAVAVRIDGHHVGHLSREDAEIRQPGVIELTRRHGRPVALQGTVVGYVGMSLGVFLTFDPAEFGADRDL